MDADAEKPPTLAIPQDAVTTEPPVEIGGAKRPEPTRYGDWELAGRCVDF